MIVFLVFLIFAFWWLWKNPINGLKTIDLPLGFAIKILVSLVFIWVYTKVYGVGAETVDWEEFIRDSVILKNVFFKDPLAYFRFLFGGDTLNDVNAYLSETNHWSSGDLTLMNDSKNVLRFNSLIAFLFNGNLFFHIVFISFFYLLTFRVFLKQFLPNSFLSPRISYYSILLLPSLLFWSTSMLKEPFMIMGLMLVMTFCFGWINGQKNYLVLSIGLGLMILFKPYVLISLLPAFICFVIWRVAGKWFKWIATVSVASILLLVGLNDGLREKVTFQLTRMQYDFMNVGRGGVQVIASDGETFIYFSDEQVRYLNIKNGDSVFLQKSMIAKRVEQGKKLPFENVYVSKNDGPWPLFFRGDKCGSYIDLTPINNSFKQLMITAPHAMVNTLFRPFPWDPGSKLKWCSFIETLFIGIAVLIAFRVRKWNFQQRQLNYSLMLFIVLLSLLIGWTTPVLGAIVRYRVPIYFILFIICLTGKLKNETSNSNNRS